MKIIELFESPKYINPYFVIYHFNADQYKVSDIKEKFKNIGLILNKVEYPKVNENAKKFSLKGVDKILENTTSINIHTTNIESGILDLLKIKSLQTLTTIIDIGWIYIINRHLKDKNILKCQRELISAGLKDLIRKRGFKPLFLILILF